MTTFANLPALTPHPRSDTSSPLSSVLSEPTTYSDLVDKARERLEKYKPIADLDDTQQLLQLLLEYLPKSGRKSLMKDIIELEDDKKLRQLRDHFVDAILKPLKARGKTGPITPSPCSGATAEVDAQIALIDPSKREQATLKLLCLKRDKYRCVLSGKVDIRSVREGWVQAPGIYGAHTECAHIIPFCLADFDFEDPRETTNKAIVWAALFRYFPDIEGHISPKDINELENVMTLADFLYTGFGEFELALQQTDENNKYETKWFTDNPFCELPETVTFTSSDGSSLPNLVLLKTHFMIAKILSVSGIGDKVALYTYARDDDDRDIKPDGSSDLMSMISRRLLMQV